MKCLVCGHEVSEGSASCNNCGFQVIVALGESEEIKRKQGIAAAQYREMICRDIEVGFYAYSHSIRQKSTGEEVLERDSEATVSFGKCGNISMSQIIWYPEGFLRPLTDNLSCQIYIRRPGLTPRLRNLAIPIPAGTGDIQIGIIQISSGIFQICIGSSTSYNRSESIDVLA